MFVEAVFESTFGFSYVLFVTVVTLYHVNNVFGVAVNVMVNKSSFAGRIKCIVSKSVVYVVACKAVFSATERTAGLVSNGGRFTKFSTNFIAYAFCIRGSPLPLAPRVP